MNAHVQYVVEELTKTPELRIVVIVRDRYSAVASFTAAKDALAASVAAVKEPQLGFRLVHRDDADYSVRFVTEGTAIIGSRFDRVVIAEDAVVDKTWLHMFVLTRLAKPLGKLVDLRAPPPAPP